MDKEKILVCEDEESYLKAVTKILENGGYEVIQTVCGEGAIEKARIHRPSLIVLDINLPDIDGFEVCRILRSEKKTESIPIMMLTVRSSDIDVIEGLEVGADEYVAKPVKPKVFLARIKAMLRRGTQPPVAEKTLKSGNIFLDIEKRKCTVRSKPVYLRRKEFDLLAIFIKNKGKVFSREDLLETIWGYEYFGTTRTIDTTIGRLRKKLGPEGERIETIPAIGYKFRED